MSQLIDHDEEDRESSEYEELNEDDDDDNNLIYEKNAEIPPQEQTIEVDDVDPIRMEHYEDVFSSSESQIPVSVACSSRQTNDVDKVYYENEMEDLIIHEIFGEEHQKQREFPQYRNVIISKPSCIVCNRWESEKIRLFRWPKNEELREQWIHFFRLPPSLLTVTPLPFICSFHFTADTFVMVDERIFWKASALPRYRLRRPCISDPFPWEPEAKLKMEQIRALKESENGIAYKIRYRMPYSKHKSRTPHPVAVLSPVNQSHLFYEFHFNRDGLNDSKFYACLNCRKAKTESGIRDVIRTIHLQNSKILSNSDPFSGHHFACRPHNAYDYRSSWRNVGQTSNEVGQYIEDVVYVDERGNSIEWEPCSRPIPAGEEPIIELDSNQPTTSNRISVVENQDDNESILTENIIDNDHAIYHNDGGVATNQQEILAENLECRPTILEKQQLSIETPVYRPKLKKFNSKRLKCHLCMKGNIATTQDFVAHLQKHLENEKECRKCGTKISCDLPPIYQRRQTCDNCSKLK